MELRTPAMQPVFFCCCCGSGRRRRPRPRPRRRHRRRRRCPDRMSNEYMSDRMRGTMSDKMSEYMSDRMSEHMSVRMSVSADYSKKVILTFFFLLLVFLLLLSLSSIFTAIHPYVLYLLGIFVSLMSQHLSSNVDKDKDSKTA